MLALLDPSNKILSKYFSSFNNFFISFEIGSIFSIKISDSLSLNSAKFFPLNSLIDFSKS
jgi:hypothetical protein